MNLKHTEALIVSELRLQHRYLHRLLRAEATIAAILRPHTKGRGAGKSRSAPVRAGIPRTGTAFWLKILGKRRRTAVELVDEALSQLGLSDEARPTVRARAYTWVYLARKAGEIEPAGDKNGSKAYRVVTG